jgi:hypothetical protein
MHFTSPRQKRPAVAAFTALTCAVGLSACGGFDSAASGNNLIKDYVKRFGNGKVTVKSVDCPGGVSQKVGGSYDCKAVLHDKTTGVDHSGTITIHMVSGNKVEILGAQDLHFQ